MSVAIPDTVSGRIGKVVSQWHLSPHDETQVIWVSWGKEKETNTDNSQGCDFALT